MIACTEFIPLYSELFAFLEEEGGRPAVERYWDELADTYFEHSLKPLAAEKGVRGCWEYWSRALAEEAADIRLAYDPATDTLTGAMRRCPSKGRLLDLAARRGFRPYPGYCDHCRHLYARVLGPLGIDYRLDARHTDEARCASLVRRAAGVQGGGSGSRGEGR